MVAAYQQDISTDETYPVPELSREDLEARLERGWEIIQDRQDAGLSVTRLEEHWIGLLHTYESLFDARY